MRPECPIIGRVLRRFRPGRRSHSRPRASVLHPRQRGVSKDWSPLSIGLSPVRRLRPGLGERDPPGDETSRVEPLNRLLTRPEGTLPLNLGSERTRDGPPHPLRF